MALIAARHDDVAGIDILNVSPARILLYDGIFTFALLAADTPSVPYHLLHDRILTYAGRPVTALRITSLAISR